MSRPKNIENDPELMIDNKPASLPEDYAVRLQLARLREVEENAERLSLDNKKKRIDIEKTNCNLCYLDVAESEVNKALGPIANLVKSLDQILAVRLHLSGEQTAIVQDVIDDILRQIAAIEIQLKSTEETDAERSHQSLTEKELRKREVERSKTISRKQ